MLSVEKISFILIVIFMLFACATPQRYNTELNSMIGESESDLIAKFGKPSAKKIFSDNTEIWAYTKVDNVFVPSEMYNYNQGDYVNDTDGLFSPFLDTYLFSNNPGDIGYNAKYICKTLFMLQNGKIVAWKWQGNDCNF